MKKQKIKKRIKKEWKNIIFNTLFATISIVVVILFYKKIILTGILLSIIAIIGLIKWKSKITLILFFIGGITGAIVEMIAISFDVWEYSITNFINIPCWLFVLWGNATAFLYQTAVEIKKLVKE